MQSWSKQACISTNKLDYCVDLRNLWRPFSSVLQKQIQILDDYKASLIEAVPDYIKKIKQADFIKP